MGKGRLSSGTLGSIGEGGGRVSSQGPPRWVRQENRAGSGPGRLLEHHGVAGVVWGDVDPRRVASQRTIFAALGDRRPDVYRRVGRTARPEA
jgi:hypothetical protein